MYSFAHNLFSYCLRVTHIQLDFPFCVWVFAFMDENEIMATQSPRAHTHTIIPIMRRATTSREKNTTNKNYGNYNCFFRWCCLKQSIRACVFCNEIKINVKFFVFFCLIHHLDVLPCLISFFFFFLYLKCCVVFIVGFFFFSFPPSSSTWFDRVSFLFICGGSIFKFDYITALVHLSRCIIQ